MSAHFRSGFQFLRQGITLHSIVLLCVLALAACSPAPASPTAPVLDAPNGIAVSISTSGIAFAAGAPVVVHVTITNVSDRSIAVLKWYTPIDRIERSLFNVARDGVAAPYLGILVTHTPPTEGDYTVLAAGQKVESDVDLANYYDIKTPGNYLITYDVSGVGILREPASGTQAPVLDHLLSNQLSLTVK